MARAFIGLGSNLGDRLDIISRAIKALGAVSGARVVQVSTVIETEPCGGPPQGPFLNAAIELETGLSPTALLRVLQQIEVTLGRLRTDERWTPRTIDLDLLLYDDRIIRTADLEVPHPRLHERRFVLEPLVQLSPELRHPVLQKSVAACLAGLGPAVRSAPVAR